MDFNTTYLNRSPHKTLRTKTAFVPHFVVWHETGGYGSLGWNLRPEAQASYNYLILRNGTIYHYVDERRYIVWHAGKGPSYEPYFTFSRWEIGPTVYYKTVNTYAIGVEIEGMNDGTPITAAQAVSAMALLHYFRDTYGIPIDARYHPEHKDVAPTYKTDGRGFAIADLINRAIPHAPTTADYPIIGVAPSGDLGAFSRALGRNAVLWSEDECRRAYTFAAELAVDPIIGLCIWSHEGNFGRSPLQTVSQNPFNLKAPLQEWRWTITYNDSKWYRYESTLLGWFAGILHLKNEYGARGYTSLHTVIERFAPASDGNVPLSYINAVNTDKAYILSH